MPIEVETIKNSAPPYINRPNPAWPSRLLLGPVKRFWPLAILAPVLSGGVAGSLIARLGQENNFFRKGNKWLN